MPKSGQHISGTDNMSIIHQRSKIINHKLLCLYKHQKKQYMSIKGTKTEQNLLKSFAGESQAARRYKMFAKLANCRNV